MSLAVALKMYKVRAKKLEKDVNEKKMGEIALSREVKRLKKDVARRKCENKLLQQMTERVSGSAAREAGTSARYSHRLLEKQEPQYIEPATSLKHRVAALCGEEVSKLEHFTLQNNPKWAGG